MNTFLLRMDIDSGEIQKSNEPSAPIFAEFSYYASAGRLVLGSSAFRKMILSPSGLNPQVPLNILADGIWRNVIDWLANPNLPGEAGLPVGDLIDQVQARLAAEERLEPLISDFSAEFEIRPHFVAHILKKSLQLWLNKEDEMRKQFDEYVLRYGWPKRDYFIRLIQSSDSDGNEEIVAIEIVWAVGTDEPEIQVVR